MTWLQILAQAAIMASIIGIFVTIAAYLNGKHIKSGIIEIRNLIAKMDERMVKMDERSEERNKETKELIVEESRLTRELIAKIGVK